ncbi:MAG: DNA alkylation repair protein [Armatimonadota bacterium]
MTVDEVMTKLASLSNETVLKHNAKAGAGDNQFGVRTTDIRAIAKTIKSDHELGMGLWRTGNADAMLLATLILKPKQLTTDELEAMVRPMTYSHVADWLNSNVVKSHPAKEELRQKWMTSKKNGLGRAGWSLTTERIIKNPEGLDLSALLDRIEDEMGGADPFVQWTMNYSLAQIGILYAEHRARAIAIGEKLGVLRDYPTSKGCTSPFAPIWIKEMASRQG